MRIVLFEVGWIGDTVMTLPAMKALRGHYHDAEIIRICNTKMVYMLEKCPYIDSIIPYDRELKHKGIRGGLDLARTIKGLNPDIFINFHTPDFSRNHKYYFRDNLFAFLTGASTRVGYATSIDKYFLTHPLNSSIKPLPILELINALVEEIGCRVDDSIPHILVSKEEEETIEGILRGVGVIEGETVIGICPAAKKPYQHWLRERFTELSNRIIRNFHAKVIFIGGVNDTGYVNKIIEGIHYPVINLCGKTDLSLLPALIKRVDILVTLNSGPMHIAAAVSTPLVAIFGTTNYARWRPVADKLKCRTLTPEGMDTYAKQEENDSSYMKQIGVDEVLEAMEDLIEEYIPI